MKVTVAHDEVIIEGALCHNCGEDPDVHLEGKCPFEASTFVPMAQKEFEEAVYKLINSGRFRGQSKAELVSGFRYKTVTV